MSALDSAQSQVGVKRPKHNEHCVNLFVIFKDLRQFTTLSTNTSHVF